MAKILTSRRFGLWWQLARRWFKKENTALLNAIQNITQNISINIEDIDTTVVALESTTAKEATLTAGVADIKGDVAVVKDKVENIDIDTTDLAKQGTNPNATNTAILEAFGNIDFTTLAKQGDDPTISLTSMDAKLGNVVMATAAEETAAMADLLNNLN